MTKVVYNSCYGGFSLSDDAVKRYASLKGWTLYPEESRFGFMVYWKVPPDQRAPVLADADFNDAPLAARRASNEFYSANTVNPREFDRADPTLVQVVEEMGAAANGRCAKLQIEDVPAGTQYRIDEYDGMETVATRDSYEWSVA